MPKKKYSRKRKKETTGIKWDKWQREVLDHDGNITIRAGRQVGKSEVISSKAIKFALENPGAQIMIIAASQRQSSLLFEKVRAKLDQMGDVYADKPTLTKIDLTNGSRIYSLPAGRTGYFIRGFTIDLLIADEAAYIPEEVWKAVTPMIAVSRKVRKKGWIITLSTPFGKGGYFYETFHDKDFKSFHISAEDCWRHDPDHLKKERERMSKEEYAQEYLGEFIDDYRQFFSTDLIKKCMTFIEYDKKKDGSPFDKYYLGLDVARYGGDENAFVISRVRKEKVSIVKCLTTERVSTVDTIGKVQALHQEWKFAKIFIDDSGVGGGVTDVLQHRLGKRRVMGLNNASKKIEVADVWLRHKEGHDAKHRDILQHQGILKEDLYSNALILMEQGKLEMISDLKLLKSLKSIVFEYKESGKVRLFGNYSHLTEAMVRACWCTKEKGLNTFLINF